MGIIAKLSFWIMKPTKQAEGSTNAAFEQAMVDALTLLKRDDHVENLKTSITPESLPSDKEDLLKFLCNQTAHTSG